MVHADGSLSISAFLFNASDYVSVFVVLTAPKALGSVVPHAQR